MSLKMRFFIILSLAVFATASPARNARNEENDKKETESIGDSKVEVSFEKTKDGFPKIVVDIKDKQEENKDKDPMIAEGKEVEEVAVKKDDKNFKEPREVEIDKAPETGESRSTIHVHTPSAPQINIAPASSNIAPNRYPTPTQSRPGYGQAGSYGQVQAQTYEYKKKKESKDKPYNQVNVYVYFPKEMMGNEDSEMSVNQYNYDDGTSSSTVVSNAFRQQQKKQDCAVGFARIKGACIEIDSRKKRVL